MPARIPKERFLILLSHAREATEKARKYVMNSCQTAQDPQVKVALEARASFLKVFSLSSIRALRLSENRPVKLSGRLQEIFLEDLRKELNEIQSPAARRLFVLAELVHLAHLRIGEYAALVAAADATG